MTGVIIGGERVIVLNMQMNSAVPMLKSWASPVKSQETRRVQGVNPH